jgi:hypothetical protein
MAEGLPRRPPWADVDADDSSGEAVGAAGSSSVTQDLGVFSAIVGERRVRRKKRGGVADEEKGLATSFESGSSGKGFEMAYNDVVKFSRPGQGRGSGGQQQQLQQGSGNGRTVLPYVVCSGCADWLYSSRLVTMEFTCWCGCKFPQRHGIEVFEEPAEPAAFDVLLSSVAGRLAQLVAACPEEHKAAWKGWAIDFEKGFGKGFEPHEAKAQTSCKDLQARKRVAAAKHEQLQEVKGEPRT